MLWVEPYVSDMQTIFENSLQKDCRTSWKQAKSDTDKYS